MIEHLLNTLGRLFMNTDWYKLPKFAGLLSLIAIRDRLRKQNLHDTEDPPLAINPAAQNVVGTLRNVRTTDGTYNDLTHPQMGAVGAKFGRNVPLSFAFPDAANLMHPNPRDVSKRLMTRDTFQPATILNLLAAAWIQFMVHDWFAHKRARLAESHTIPLPEGDDFPGGEIRVPKTLAEPSTAPTRPPAYANRSTHWWDLSQIYGSEAELAMGLRTMCNGRMRIGDNGRLECDPVSGLERTGFTDNWWVGLSIFHTLFVLEHNHICDRLAAHYPAWSDQDIYDKARLINAALAAKIHTVEWTPAIVPHPTAAEALRINWRGIVGEDIQEILKAVNDEEILGGIVGSSTDHHGVPFSLTEEFVSVYRMHPLIPDEFTIVSHDTGDDIQSYAFNDVAAGGAGRVSAKHSWEDIIYSFAINHPGAVQLHNYPKHLQTLARTNEYGEAETLDLAAVDILRDRERGVPRYNQFRRLVGKAPVMSFEELTSNPAWREEIRQVYAGNLEMVDLMTGLYAEPIPEGFGFSETAFRIFILMASRRLKSDRFFTADFRPEIYTEWGYQHVRETGLVSMLSRHFPALGPKLAGVDNPFAPWKPHRV
jgi:hypothetical protein